MSIYSYYLIFGIVFFIGIEGKRPIGVVLAQRINSFLDIINSEKVYDSTLETYVDNDATLDIHKNEAMLFLKKFFPFESLRPEIVQLYSEFYTLPEVNGLIEFYSSPLGKKHLATQTKTEDRVTELVEEKMVKMMPQITAWFKETFNQLNKTSSKI